MSKLCVITGVGAGNGASFSRRFTREGYRIVMLARNLAYLETLATEIPGSVAMECDVRDPGAIQQVFARIHEEIGTVDTLIYNAGAGEWASIMDTSLEGMESSWATNTLGLVACAQQVIPSMTENGEGNIMVIGATASLRGGAQSTAFASAKAAQRSVAQSMARDLGPKGIHVGYLIIDGIIDIERTRARFPDRANDFFMQPDAIADSVYALTQQDRSAWAFEIDLRPYGEKW
ncbi:MAG TPA: short-chain dehydrogenase [Gammaproteobacteria bacterium]|nr:MAG: short-chain dehydrogenase [Candidatus Endolissoclinum sp. TMED55]HAU40474.1 short-chain dehydrogenase [Gammaproteobacteria bacterium]